MDIPDLSGFSGKFTPEQVRAGQLIVALLTAVITDDLDQYTLIKEDVLSTPYAFEQLVAFTMGGIDVIATMKSSTQADVIRTIGSAYSILMTEYTEDE